MIKVINEEIDVEHRHCDVCESEIEYEGATQCESCGCDLCYDCSVEADDIYTEEFTNMYCPDCVVIGEKYIKLITKIEDEIDRRITGLVDEVHQLQCEYEIECEAKYVKRMGLED